MNKHSVRIKICGIGDLETALGAVEAGADALGFVFAPSRRMLSPDKAREIIKRLPPFISRVGVFVNLPADQVEQIAGYTGLDTVQLHGDESPEYCKAINGYKVIKSFSVSGEQDMERAMMYEVDGYLLDTPARGLRGGTGIAFDWKLAACFSAGPLVLAGGLCPENVRQAINLVRPYAVDVSSGVETEGQKDINKIKHFVRRVKGD
ncbi:MAG: N-(5'-phosphoribosyl)anthranilate isomerase [Peptococcaceae bacterium BRH_c4a]|nr:MAG: N-(5'-phosphoribosyl)anthranilate isomerase [Peptococcaceae bacterium BRH_c4a]